MKSILTKSNIFALLLFSISTSTHAAFITFQGGTAEEAIWQSTVGSYSLETFDGFASGDAITTLPSVSLQLEPLLGTAQPSIYTHHVTNTPSGNNQLALFPNGTPTAGYNSADMVVRPTDGAVIYSLSLWNGDPQGDMVVSVFDQSDILIGAITAAINTGNSTALSGSFAGFISTVPIGRLVFEGSTGDGWNHIDNIQVSTVPIPAAVWLLGSGIIGLLSFARRK